MSPPTSRFRTPWLDAVRPPAGTVGTPVPPPEQRGTWQTPTAPARRPIWVGGAFFAFGALALLVLARAASGDAEAMGGLIAGVVVLVLTYYIARAFARMDGNPLLVPIIMGGICLKLIGAFARYRVSTTVYSTGDFLDYDQWGRKIAEGLRHGHLVMPPGRLAGTNFMRVVTGYVYFATPARIMSGFVVFSFLSFVGLLFFWRAYRVGLSRTHDVTYLQWVVIMPSLLYWPSAIGKDAFMVLGAGVAAYGAACLLTSRTVVGVLSLSAGIAGMVMVRPHFALAVCGGLAFATLLRKQRGGFVRTIVTLAFVIGLGLIVIGSAKTFFGISAFNQSSITKTLNDASAQSADGGSQFNAVVVNSPVKFPLAAVTVLYRPLPYEVHSPQELGTAMEGLVLALLTIRALPRIWRALRRGRRLPYLLYCLGALLVFIIAFSGFSNFGILARERAVIQPLFLVFLALPRDPEELLSADSESDLMANGMPIGFVPQ